MGEDEADTARAVRERREAAQPIVANLGGRIVKTAATACCWNFPPSSLPSKCATGPSFIQPMRPPPQACKCQMI